MTRRIAVLTGLLSLAVALPPADAARLGKGNSVIWVGLNGNESQLLGPTTGASNTFESGELGVHAAYSYFLCDAWTACVSGGYDVGKSDFVPATGTTEKFSSHSFNVRVGGDRYAFVNDDVAVYAGPGLMYWRGMGKYEGSGSAAFDRDWPRVNQFGLNGRFGLYARLASHYGLFGHIGQVIARNSSKDSNGKNTWWTNHHEGSVGLAVDF